LRVEIIAGGAVRMDIHVVRSISGGCGLRIGGRQPTAAAAASRTHDGVPEVSAVPRAAIARRSPTAGTGENSAAPTAAATEVLLLTMRARQV